MFNELLQELIHLIYKLDKGEVPHVSTDIRHVYVHFFNEDGEDIGNLGLGVALNALQNEVHTWPDSSTEQDENGEPVADLDIREAKTIQLQTH